MSNCINNCFSYGYSGISYLSKPIIFVAQLVFLLKKDSISFNIFNKEPFKVALSIIESIIILLLTYLTDIIKFISI